MKDTKICPQCGGSGKIDEGTCSPPGVCDTCNGSGRIEVQNERN